MTHPDRRYDLHDKIAWQDVAKEFGVHPSWFEEEYEGEDIGLDPVIQPLAEEIVRLRRVIAYELTENDELGAEYTYVRALQDAVREWREYSDKLREALEQAYVIINDEFCGTDDHHPFCRGVTEALALQRPGEK